MHIFLIIKKQNVKFNLSLIAKKSNDLLANSVNVNGEESFNGNKKRNKKLEYI